MGDSHLLRVRRQESLRSSLRRKSGWVDWTSLNRTRVLLLVAAPAVDAGPGRGDRRASGAQAQHRGGAVSPLGCGVPGTKPNGSQMPRPVARAGAMAGSDLARSLA